MYWKIKRRAAASAMVVAAVLAGCGDGPAEAPQAAQALAAPVTVKHQLGTTTVANVPRKVAVLDMNEADFLDQLGVPIAGMTKDYVPHFLSKYKDAPDVQDLGAIVQPTLSACALKPDLILITPIQANHYQELAEIAPTLHFDVDYKNSQRTHITTVKQHLLTLGRIFDKEALARQKAAELDAKGGRSPARDRRRPKAMIVMHNNGAFSAFGVRRAMPSCSTPLACSPPAPPSRPACTASRYPASSSRKPTPTSCTWWTAAP